MNNKIKSFTLSELLIVIIITAIIVGTAFSVIRLVQKQIFSIQKNYNKSTNLSLFEQRLLQDFNEYNEIEFNDQENKFSFKSEIDNVTYTFHNDFILRNQDSVKLKLVIEKVFMEGKLIKNGTVDAVSISGEAEIYNYKIFVSKKNDLTLTVNQENGF